MVISQKFKVAFKLPPSMQGHKAIQSYLGSKNDPDFRIFRIISEAMKVDYQTFTYDTTSNLLSNNSWTGAIGMVNRSEVDMAPALFIETEERREAVHFSYPFRLSAFSFVVEKPDYSPQTFGILKAFSIYVWLAFAFMTMTVVVTRNMSLKRKYGLLDVIFDSLATCLKQPIIIKPWTLCQRIFTYNWIIGTTFLGFCYTSVLLSFLTFPSVHQIRTLEDLAHAVENDGYNCMFEYHSAVAPKLMATSKLKAMTVIGENVLAIPNGFGKLEDFFRNRRKKFAFFNLKEAIPYLPDDYYYVSDDNAIEGMAAMIVSKNFCCKEQLDEISLRVMAAGLYAKVKQDSRFLSSLKFEYADVETKTERQLNLKDFSLAFSMLLFGYVLSIVALVCEVVFGNGTFCLAF